MSSLARALISLALVAACNGDKVDYHKVEFPGFSLEVPTTVKYAAGIDEYRAGQSDSKGMFRIVKVSWQVGEVTTVDEMPMIAESMRAAMPSGTKQHFDKPFEITLKTHKATQVNGKIDDIDVSFVDVECGKRSIMILIIAASGIEGMRKRIFDSYDCHPLEAEEGAIGTTAVPIGIDNPETLAGWTRSADPDGQFILQKDNLVFVAAQTARVDIEDPDMVMKALPKLFEHMGMSWEATRQDTQRGRTLYYGHANAEGTDMDAVLTMFPCAGRGDGVMVMLMAARGESLDGGMEALLGVRCSRSGDAPLDLKATDEAPIEDAPPEEPAPDPAPKKKPKKTK